MSLAIFLAFLQYVFIYSYTPGPANFFSLKVGSQYGYRHFLKVYPGLFCGCLTIMLICNILMNTCQRVMPNRMIIFHYLGIIYILWVAWHIFKSKPIQEEETTGELIKKPTFMTGLLLNLSNMKIMIFGITLLISSSTLFWGYFGKMFSKFLSQHYKICNTVMAALLVCCAF